MWCRRFSVPPAISLYQAHRRYPNLIILLQRSTGSSPSSSVEVSPAGLGAVVWDGEGHEEWLASEHPCLAIRTDHSIAALLVSMATDPDLSLELTSVTPGEPMFVQLPQLPVGLLTVR